MIDRSIEAVVARLRFGDSDGDDHDIAADYIDALREAAGAAERERAALRESVRAAFIAGDELRSGRVFVQQSMLLTKLRAENDALAAQLAEARENLRAATLAFAQSYRTLIDTQDLLREALDAWTGDGPPIDLDRIRAALERQL